MQHTWSSEQLCKVNLLRLRQPAVIENYILHFVNFLFRANVIQVILWYFGLPSMAIINLKFILFSQNESNKYQTCRAVKALDPPATRSPVAQAPSVTAQKILCMTGGSGWPFALRQSITKDPLSDDVTKYKTKLMIEITDRNVPAGVRLNWLQM